MISTLSHLIHLSSQCFSTGPSFSPAFLPFSAISLTLLTFCAQRPLVHQSTRHIESSLCSLSARMSYVFCIILSSVFRSDSLVSTRPVPDLPALSLSL